MSNHRKLACGLVVAILGALAATRTFAADFEQRVASWQGGGAPPGAGAPHTPPANRLRPQSAQAQYAPAQSSQAQYAQLQYAQPQDAAPAAPLPAPSTQLPAPQQPQQPSVLSQQYQPQPRTPEYGPVPHDCATCGPHAPLQPPLYGPVYDSCGAGGCGPAGCGPIGCGPLACLLGCGHGGPAGCGGEVACGHGGWDAGPGCAQTLVWARFDVLLWWRQGRDFPPLVTTSPIGTDATEAGILPDATILFGGDREASNMQAGGRFDIGWWTDLRQCTGIGWRFWGLGRDAAAYNVSSLREPILAVPFFNLDEGEEDALLVAYPGLRNGRIGISANSEVLGNDVYGRFLLCRDHNSRLDFITGWHFSRINDDVAIRSQSTATEVGGNIPLGTVTTVVDSFETRNEFHGGILGLQWERDCGCWTTRVLARMSIGNMNERAIVRGQTSFAVPGEDVEVTAGGLFTGEGNIGEFQRDEFTAVTEVGLTFGYRCNPCTLFTVGYTFIYWNDVLSAASLINPNVGEDGPQFAYQHSDYWVQGLSLGLVREF